MIALALSTSTPRAGVALVDGDRVLADLSYEDPRGHAERLFALIEDALTAAQVDRSEIGLVASDIGPGSFTGVRIAVASAKGIAVGLRLPMMGVVSLEAMAAQARGSWESALREGAVRADAVREGGLREGALAEGGLVAAAIDAKKDELYLAIYAGEEALLAPSHLPRGEVAARVAEVAAGRPLVSIVDAAELAGFAGAAATQAIVSAPSAAWVGRIAAARLAAMGAGAAADPADVVPLYVRAPDAVPSISVHPGPFGMLPSR